MKDTKLEVKIAELKKMYENPLSSNRSGALYNAFSYPTKISPESIAIFIACHTKIGAVVLDPFAGSGTTGLAIKLCDCPSPTMIETSKSLGLNPKWGPRTAVLYELSTLGALISNVMCNPPIAISFEKAAKELLSSAERELGYLYEIIDNEGVKGVIRYIIWSDVLVCPTCGQESTFWESSVQEKPLNISSVFKCNNCGHSDTTSKVPRATEQIFDPILKEKHTTKKRVPVKIYGRTGKKTWNRIVTNKDKTQINNFIKGLNYSNFPLYKIDWGVLYRKGYHQGISHLHHFYTQRNAAVFLSLWGQITKYPEEIQEALKLLLLSYNSSHSTLMTRVVVKKNSSDFVITGSQSGVLYISSLPIEKNIFEGVRRKISTLKKAFSLIGNSKSSVAVFNQSSTLLNLESKSIDYVFTDPPFGDYIPYSEINQINEAWLDSVTVKANEVIVNTSQKKDVLAYSILMQSVFSEVNRVLKDDGLVSVVFHSAKSEIWQALIDSYQKSNLRVIMSSILDKIQNSFKQTNSTVKVQGDPILLLAKTNAPSATGLLLKNNEDDIVIKRIINAAFIQTDNLEEQKPERLFSRYINACLELGHPVSYNANEFYKRIKKEMPENQLSR